MVAFGVVLMIFTIIMACVALYNIITMVFESVEESSKNCNNCMYRNFGRTFHPCRDCKRSDTRKDYWKRK